MNILENDISLQKLNEYINICNYLYPQYSIDDVVLCMNPETLRKVTKKCFTNFDTRVYISTADYITYYQGYRILIDRGIPNGEVKFCYVKDLVLNIDR